MQDFSPHFRRLRDLYAKGSFTEEEEHRLLEALDKNRTFLYFYNLASVAGERNEKDISRRLFNLLKDLIRDVNPELAGKSCYKLALLSETTAEIQGFLEECLELYPEHRAARKLVQEIKKQSGTQLPDICIASDNSTVVSQGLHQS